MFAGIPNPPMPSTTALLVAGGGGVLLGLALALRGAANGRVVLALTAAVVAGACSSLLAGLADQLKDHPTAVAIAAAVTVGLLAFVFGRVLWAIVLGAVLGIAAMGVITFLYAGEVANAPVWSAGEAADFPEWARQFGAHLRNWVAALWRHKRLLVGGSTGLIAFGVAFGMLLPRVTLLLTSSVVGAVAFVAGAGMLLWAGEVRWAAQFTHDPFVPAIVATALAMIGIVLQTYLELARRRAAKDEADQPKAGAAAAGGAS